MRARLLFRAVWWLSNLLLAVALGATIWSGVSEYSLRHYLKGFSDAVVPEAASPQQKAEAILDWMSKGPPRLEVQSPAEVSPRDPRDTLNYRQLLEVCGSATNAFLNLSRSAGIETRRLLLLTPERTTKHVVAEVYVADRWVIVDPSYRAFLKDARGNLLTRKDLQNPELFREATSYLPNYPPEYTYERFAHVRTAALPFRGAQVRRVLDHVVPGWDEYVDWSLLLERRSFLYFFLSVDFLVLLMIVRMILGWLADHRLRVPRFHLRANLSRATAAFFTTPEIK
ncbi:MAG TPA: transglutaminase-like domain-containing protein [Candidatus Limnocylindrales bacterium]|nr:transglutaminase-like domain-containing protein [Candidatus Limnocylindrales bacterium]